MYKPTVKNRVSFLHASFIALILVWSYQFAWAQLCTGSLGDPVVSLPVGIYDYIINPKLAAAGLQEVSQLSDKLVHKNLTVNILGDKRSMLNWKENRLQINPEICSVKFLLNV